MGLNETVFRCDCDFPHTNMWINRGELFFLIGDESGFLLSKNGIIKTTIPERQLKLYFRSLNNDKL